MKQVTGILTWEKEPKYCRVPNISDPPPRGKYLIEITEGMLRREDAEVFRHVPIGIIPVGENNTLSTR